MKRMFFEMPIVAMVVMMSVVCSCGNSGNANQDQSPTDSVVDESTGMEDADVDANMIEKRLHEMLTKLITKDGDIYLPEYFTEGFNTFYTRACEKADKEGMERPRIWWQYSEDDPNQFTIKSIKVISGDEACSDLELKGNLLAGIYEVILKKEKDNWLIDKVTEKDNYSLEMEENSESQNTDDLVGYDGVLSDRNLTESDLRGKSKRELEIMRNSIYARYGYKFKREDLLNYFSQYSWYNPQTSDMATVYKAMTNIEKFNVEFIKKHE